MYTHPDPCGAITALIDRVCGRGAEFTLELIADEGSADVFEVSAGFGGQPVLRGSNAVALATAFGHYLKYTARQFYAYAGPDRVELPDVLPQVTEPVRVVFPSPYRHYFNNENCEYSYTADFFDEAQWTHRLDWMAMNGFNLFMYGFTPVPVWLTMADKLGLRQEHIDRLLGMTEHGIVSGKDPALAWEKARFVARRAYELGMEPEFRPFYGIVPDLFTGTDVTGTFFEKGEVLVGSPWEGFPGPKVFGPRDSQRQAFHQLALWYYEAQREAYGLNDYGARQSFFIGDCNSEAGFIVVHPDYPINRVVERSMAAMLDYNPQATWISSSWRLVQDVIEPYDPAHFLVIDLECDFDPKWQASNSFWGRRWLWSMLHNFGGNNGLSGSLDVIATHPVLARQAAPLMSGTAISPEGSEQNPAIYDLMAEMNWRGQSPGVAAWLDEYILRRYGCENPELHEAWRILHATVYSRVVMQGPLQSLVAARPRLAGRCQARFWGTNDIPYPPQALIPAWAALLKAAESCPAQTLRYDLVDVGRQVLADYALAVYGDLRAAHDAGDAAAFDAAAGAMVTLCHDMDTLVATREEFLLGRRLAAARALSSTAQGQDYCEQAERTLLTIWVPNTPGRDLEDYCNRHWSGLLGDYYAGRWQLLRDWGLEALQAGHRLDEDAFQHALDEYELAFTRRQDEYPMVPNGDPVTIGQVIYERYVPVITAAWARRG